MECPQGSYDVSFGITVIVPKLDNLFLKASFFVVLVTLLVNRDLKMSVWTSPSQAYGVLLELRWLFLNWTTYSWKSELVDIMELFCD